MESINSNFSDPIQLNPNQEIDPISSEESYFDMVSRWFGGLFSSSGDEPQPLDNSRFSLPPESQPANATEAICGVVGEGEMFRRIRVTWINGIDHTHDESKLVAERISKAFGGVNVHYVYNKTDGFWYDLWNASSQRFLGNVTPEVKGLAAHFKALIAELGGTGSDGKIFHLAHSHGAIITYMAKAYLTPEERQMIHVVTFGAAQTISSKDYGSAVNFMSTQDPLLFFNSDALSVWKSGKPTNEIICLDPILSNGYIDHSMEGETYAAALKVVADHFRGEYETTTTKVLAWLYEKWNELFSSPEEAKEDS